MALTTTTRALAPVIRQGLASTRAAALTTSLVLPSQQPTRTTTTPPSARRFHTSPRHAQPASSSFGSGASHQTYFQSARALPVNTVIRFVPQQTAWVVERMGKFHRILEPGLAILIPFLDRIAYVKSLKENALEIPSQSAITADNVTLELDGVLYTRVFDAYKARYFPPPRPPPPKLTPPPPPTATASKTPNTPSPNSRKPRCAPKSAN